MKRFVTLAAAAMLMAAPAYAQVAGKWTGEQQGRQGPQPVVLEIKADGTGTMTTGTQPGVALAEGKVAGAKVEFKINREVQGRGQISIAYKGEVKGDELTLTMEGGMGGGGGGGGGAAGAAGAAPAAGAAAGAGGAGGGGQPRPPLVLKRAK